MAPPTVGTRLTQTSTSMAAHRIREPDGSNTAPDPATVTDEDIWYDFLSSLFGAGKTLKDLKRELPGLRTVRCWEGYNKWAEAGVGDEA